MTQPDALKSNEPLFWSTGRGTDVWALFVACAEGPLAEVKRLLEKDPTLARCHYHYRTPIYFAVREDRLEVVAYLLEHGADPLSLAVNDDLLEITRDRGYREMEQLLAAAFTRRFGASPAGEPVAAAIRERNPEKVRALLAAAPELLHAGDERSSQPIHWAVMTRQLDLIDFLLERGADINAPRFDGARPIHLTNGDYHYRGWRDVPKDVGTAPEDVFKHLVARGAQVDIGMAAATGDLARVRGLLDRDASLVNRVSDYGSYYLGCGAPIKNAAAQGHIEIVRLLLERGADPNLPEEGIAPRGHALYSAVANGHYDIARLLLEHGAYPNVEVESSADTLSRAISRGDRPMIDLLCSYGAARPVHLLAHDDDLQTAAAVFAVNPALADDPDALGSASSGFVQLMLRHQPDLPRRVTVAKSREVNELLFRHGMDPSRPDWLGITPLHEFARKGDAENAAQFLDHGADLEVRDDDIRSSPLAWAAKFGRILMVELFLRRGARIRLPDDPPWATPASWAERRGHAQIAEALRHYERWGTLPGRLRLTDYQRLVGDLAAAYETGGSEAIQRLCAHFQFDRVPSHERFQEEMRRRLPRLGASTRIPHEDAQLLTARLSGFADWADLAGRCERLDRETAVVAVRKSAERAIIDGDVPALERLLAENPEGLKVLYRMNGSRCDGKARDFGGEANGIMLREHHFDTQEAFDLHRAAVRDPHSVAAVFESAVEAVVAGDLESLGRLLRTHPDLTRARSSRNHRATLLHYVGANGVENFRQKTPRNAVAVAEMLLNAGAEIDASALMYGGATTLGLVATSVHPERARVQIDLLQTLLDRGASIDHPQGAGNQSCPVVGCLANGRQRASEFLRDRGARLDLEAAAGVGRLDLVRQFFDGRGRLGPEATEGQMESGFQWACEYGRMEIVRFLLDRGVNPAEPHRGQTGLHWAAYAGHGDLVKLLLDHGALVEVRDLTWNHSPLGWAIYGWKNPPPGGPLERYREVVAHLVAADSGVEADWLEDEQVRADRLMLEALQGGPARRSMV